MRYLSVINFIRYYVDDFCCDLTISRKSYIDACRSLVKRVESLYLDSRDIDDFIIKLYDEILLTNNTVEQRLFGGLVSKIKDLKEKFVIF